MTKELIEAGALRQLRHNDGSEGFVAAYDKDITDRVFAQLAARPVADAGEVVAWEYEWFHEFSDSRFHAPHWTKDVSRHKPTPSRLNQYRNIRPLTYADSAAPSARTLSDAEINAITMGALGKWPSFGHQSWACKVVHAVLAASGAPAEAPSAQSNLKAASKQSQSSEAPSVRDQALEEAARICDNLHDRWKWDDEPDSDSGPRSCAAAIRALQGKPLPKGPDHG